VFKIFVERMGLVGVKDGKDVVSVNDVDIVEVCEDVNVVGIIVWVKKHYGGGEVVVFVEELDDGGMVVEVLFVGDDDVVEVVVSSHDV
jgi:hypothetical protein